MIDIFPAGADMLSLVLLVYYALDEPFSIFWLIATRQVTEKIKEIHHLVECEKKHTATTEYHTTVLFVCLKTLYRGKCKVLSNIRNFSVYFAQFSSIIFLWR